MWTSIEPIRLRKSPMINVTRYVPFGKSTRNEISSVLTAASRFSASALFS